MSLNDGSEQIPKGMYIYNAALPKKYIEQYLDSPLQHNTSNYYQVPNIQHYEIINEPSDPLAKQPYFIKKALYKSQLSSLYRMINMEKYGGFAFSIYNSNLELPQYIENKYNGIYKVDGLKFGVIGDSPGSGKTLIALSIIKNNELCKYQNCRVLDSGSSSSYIVQKLNHPVNSCFYISSTLIIVPHSLFKQWKETINNQTDLIGLFINNKKSLEQLYLKQKNNESEQEFYLRYQNLVEKNDLILVSSTFIRQFIATIQDNSKFKLNCYNWKRVIIDEADSISIPSMPHLSSQFTWYITATYPNLTSWQPKTVRLRNIIPENIIGYVSVKCDQSYIDQSIKLPPFFENIYNCNNPYKYLEEIQKQYNIFSSDVWEKINAMNFEEAIKDIGGNIKSESDIIKLTTDKIQKTINNKVKEIDFVKGQEITESSKKQRIKTLNSQIKDLEDKKNGIVTRISNIQIWGDLEKVMKVNDFIEFKEIICDFYEEEISFEDAFEQIDIILNKVKNPFDNMKERVITAMKSGEKLCSICVDIYQNPVILSCNHVYCAKCIFNWMKKDAKNKCCPYCKTPINPQELNLVGMSNHSCKKEEKAEKQEEDLIIKSKTEQKIEYISNNDKIDTIEKIIDENKNGKYLIFSNYDGTFEKIGDMLTTKNLKFKTLKGGCGVVSNMLEDFKNGKINVLMLNTNHKGAGLEITAATDIIMTHVMDKELNKQVIGRAQRLGRTTPLNVHILKYQNENF